MTDNLNTYELDGAPFEVTVVFPAGSPVTSITGGAAVALAEAAGVIVQADSCTITAGNKIAVQFGSDDLDEGVYTVQVRVTMPGQAPRTVWEGNITVRRSLRVPA